MTVLNCTVLLARDGDTIFAIAVRLRPSHGWISQKRLKLGL